MLKIFHTSDLHIGMTFRAYPDPEIREKLINARFECLERLIDISNKNQCDLFIVAGDLFDSVFVPKNYVLEVSKILKGFQGKLILILPGNHDFILSDQSSLWSYFKDNSDDNVILLERNEPYYLTDYELDVCLYPAPCSSKNSSESSIKWILDFKKNKDVKLHIGIAHGSLEDVSIDYEGKYYPMKKDDLLKCGLDMWLLGHAHIQYPDDIRSMSNIFYAGTPEPDGFDCKHEGKAWILEIEDNKFIKPVSISSGKYRFLYEEIFMNDGKDIEKIKELYSSRKYKDTLLKLRLKGRLKEDLYNEMLEVLKVLKVQLLYVNFIDEVEKEITIDIINNEFTEGSFPYKLLTSLLDDPEALHMAYDLIKEVKI